MECVQGNRKLCPYFKGKIQIVKGAIAMVESECVCRVNLSIEEDVDTLNAIEDDKLDATQQSSEVMVKRKMLQDNIWRSLNLKESML